MGSLFSFSFFFSSFLNFLAAREQLKKESEEDYQQRLRLEQETKQQLKTMKANAVGRADKELDDNVLAAREQLKKESADELKEKLAREKQTVKELATMKVLIFVCLFVVVPLLFRCWFYCYLVLPRPLNGLLLTPIVFLHIHTFIHYCTGHRSRAQRNNPLQRNTGNEKTLGGRCLKMDVL